MFNQYTVGLFRVIAKNGDPEVRKTSGGSSVVNFTAVPLARQDQEPIWYKITIWGTLAEMLEGNLKHSDVFMIGGEVGRSKWGDEDDPKYDDTINVRSIQRVQPLPLKAYTQGESNEGMEDKVKEVASAATTPDQKSNLPF